MKISLSDIPIKPRDAASYILLPRILPRLREIGFKFSFVASLMATMFALVGLLPLDHPYLSPANHGKFSVRQVFIAAAFRLKFRRTHIDQIIMFGLLLTALVLLIAQFVLMFAYLVTGVAYAGIFTTADPTNDIAFILLDRVFGVPGFFNSCIANTGVTCDPTSNYLTPYEPTVFPEPFQMAMHGLFGYYSMGMMLVGGAILAYFIVSVILESVQSGVPFGHRFASVYAPIRLCMAVLLIVPMPMTSTTTSGGYLGYNAAQYLTLFAAKMGSGLGTNMWVTFNNYFVIGGAGSGPGTPTGYGSLNVTATSGTNTPAAELVARPRPAAIDPLLKFIYMAQTCRAIYEISPPGNAPRGGLGEILPVRAYVIGRDGYMGLATTSSYANARTISQNGPLIIAFGYEDPDSGDIDPICGKLMLRIPDLAQPGSAYLAEQHFLMVANMWENAGIIAFGDRMARIHMPLSGTANPCAVAVPNEALWGPNANDCRDNPTPDYYLNTRDAYQAILQTNVDEARNRQITATNSAIDPRILSRGWAGAGIWYNRLAAVNGSLFEAARALPEVISMPRAMENVFKQRMQALEQFSATSRYTPAARDRADISTPSRDMALALNEAYLYFQEDDLGKPIQSTNSGSAILDLMNTMFGTQALFDMRTSTDVNPLVQMLALGKSMIDHTIYSLLFAGGLEFSGGVMSELDSTKNIGEGLLKISDAWFSIALLGLGFGIMLYYVIPFLPFIYFFFSVIKWVESIFEAMIGMPLWALAHLRIEGDGIPGEAAMDGYFLILEIFLRPALTIFGMMASFVIFTAMVYTLNDIYDIAVSNVGSFNPGTANLNPELRRGSIDEFFFTVLYAVLVYMIANSCFKLIDRVPANILQWMGSQVRNIIDDAGDPVPELIRNTYFGAFGMHIVQKAEGSMIGQAVEGLQSGLQGTGRLVGGAMNMMKNP